MTTATDNGANVTVLPWDDFERMFSRAHRQGEHIASVGPTGSGKTTALLSLCIVLSKRTTRDRRPASVTVIGTKHRDDTLAALNAEGWPIVRKWPPAYGQEHCIVWPRGGDPETLALRQRRVIRPLLSAIYQEGGQTVCFDEEIYFEESPPDGLGMRATMQRYWQEGRSSKLTIVAGTQRPRNVVRSMWSEPSWVIIFAPDDDDDLARVAQLSGCKERVLEIVPQLGGHEFLCVRRQRHEGIKRLYVSRVE